MIRIGDLLLLIEEGVQPQESAILRGRIEKIHRAASRTFVQLKDQTGTMQVVVPGPSPEGLEPGGLWEFEGPIDLSSFRARGDANPRPTVVAQRSSNVSTGGEAGRNLGAPIDVHRRFFERGVTLARLRRISSMAFEGLGFVEVEPKLITLSAPLSGLEPLQISYVGFGAPAHLCPSPADQLQQILATTGVTSVFAVSRIFSTTFRDESTSNEALTLMAMRVARDEAADVPTVLERAFAQLSREPHLAGVLADTFDSPGGRLRTREMRGAPRPLVSPVSRTTLESYDTPSHHLAESGGHAPELFQRLVAPERTILAERAIVPWIADAKLEVTTVHLERLAALYFDTHSRPLAVARAWPASMVTHQ